MKKYRVVDSDGDDVEGLEGDSIGELSMNIQQWVAIALRSAYPDMGTSRDPGVAVEKFYRKHGRLPNEKDHKCSLTLAEQAITDLLTRLAQVEILARHDTTRRNRKRSYDEVCRLREAVDMIEGNYCRLSEQYLKAMEVLAHVENYNERYMNGKEIDLCPESNCPGCPGCPAYRENAEPSCSYRREYQILKEGI